MKTLPPIAIGKPPEKRLDEKLAYGKTGDNETQFEVRGALLGHVDREERDDESQAHDDDRPRQGDQD